MRSAEAWADESFAERASAGFYILAATLVPAHRRDHVRTIRRALRGNHSGKLHWNDLEPRERKQAAEHVAALDEVHVVVAASPVPVRRQERARRVCLERLIVELHQQGVTTLFMESRGSRRLDSRDVTTVRHARHSLPSEAWFRVEHVRGHDEPLTWLSDIIAGACHDQRTI